MRAVIIGHRFFPRPGAASLRLGHLVRELQDGGYQCEVFTQGLDSHAPPPSAADKESWGLARGTRIALLTPARGTSGDSRRVLNLLRFSAAVFGHRFSKDVTLVVADPPPPVALAAFLRFAARRRRPLLCLYYADSWAAMGASSPRPLMRGLSWTLRRLELACLRRADVVAAVTPSLAARAVAARRGSDGVLVVPNQVNPHAVRGCGTRDATSVDVHEMPVLTYLGNMGAAHGATVFADAADQLWAEGHRFSLVYAGYGKDWQDLRNRAEAREDGQLVVLPELPFVEGLDLLRRSTAALVSMVDEGYVQDSVPVKALYAAEVGCPLLVAARGRFARAAERSGVVVSDPEPHAVAEALRRVLGGEGSRAPEPSSLQADGLDMVELVQVIRDRQAR